MKVAVIPARGGSKRIPRKNIRPFMGKPIIAHSIDAARASGVFDRVIVTTDDAEIADVAKQHGAEVPFMRPRELSDDHTGTHEVIGHAVRWLIDHGTRVTAACSIYATAPFIDPADLKRGLEILEDGRWHSVLAATTFPFPIFRAFEQTGTGGLRMFFPEHYRTRSQDLPVALHDAGQFAWATTSTWLAPPAGFSENMTTVLLPRWRVQDIDTTEDWERAEMIWKVMHRPG
jgi:pseudaminic acid cytidylyltransferase